ncbi:hypothetical protein BH24CHL7_BH24CHL7_13070 [soil metagenome]
MGMSQRPGWLVYAALGVMAVFVFMACTGAPTTTTAPTSAATEAPAPATDAPATDAPATDAPATDAPATDEPGESPDASPGETTAPAGGMVYPEEPVACGENDYTGNISQIRALDERTVEFTLCNSDVGFLSKIAFAAFGINDTAYLEEAAASGAIVSHPNGTGPYKFVEWSRGNRLVMERNDDYWGQAAVAQNLEFRWSTQSAQRLLELDAGTVDAIDNVGPDDFESVQGNTNLQLLEREGINVFYLGMNNFFEPWDNEQVRQAIALGIDKQRIVDNFYPPGSVPANYFTPVLPNGDVGEPFPAFDQEAARQLLTDAGFPDGFSTTIQYRNVVRGYLPDPVIVAQDLQAQLADIGITAEIVEIESGAFIDQANAGELDGLHMLGWGADYPDVSNFLDFHFGAGARDQFGAKFDDITSALDEGAQGANDEERRPAYEAANTALSTHVPMVPIAHGGSAVAYRADVENAHASPLGNEQFAGMNPGGRDTFVWMQNAEPIGIYCADETDGESLRACEQMVESLYAYEVGGVEAVPSLAEECTPNEGLTVWTCTLREGVTFHNGATLDADDVVLSYAVQWDVEHPLHLGRVGDFSYFTGLLGGFLNAPPPAPEP